MEKSIFSKIIAGEIPSYKITEDEKFYAFLDINPLAIGHTLVVPKKEVDYIFDLDDQTLTEMILFSKKVADALTKAIECLRVGIIVVGLEVPHAHIHLIPISKEADMVLSNPRLKLEPKEFKSISEDIRAYF